MPETPLVPPTKVALHLGLAQPEQLDNSTTELITDAILDAQRKLAGYLRRPLAPAAVVRAGLVRDDNHPETSLEAWPPQQFDDYPVTVASVTPSTSIPDTWDVTFHVGLDVASDPDLADMLTFIRQDACAALEQSPALAHLVQRRVSSVSAEGQSISYEKAPASSAQAGGRLELSSFARLRRMAVGSAAPIDARPWPYGAR